MSNTSTQANPELVLPAPPVPTVAVAGTTARFSVRRIICVGRNYAAHAREMGRDPDREAPFFFLKPADSVVDSGTTVGLVDLVEDHQELQIDIHADDLHSIIDITGI
jgi:fumarylpyruvate hydrolase